MSVRLTKESNFIVINEFVSHDALTLKKCYQPIIGTTSTSLMFFLLETPHLTMVNAQTLLELLNVKITDLLAALYNLEALALIERYDNGTKVVLKVNMPLPISYFLNETVLVNLLTKRTSKDYVASLMLEEFDLSSYTNNSKTFSDIFGINQEIAQEIELNDALMPFNFEKFAAKMYITKGIEITGEFAEELRKYIIISNCDSKQAALLVTKSLDINRVPKVSDLRRYAYQEKTKEELEKVFSRGKGNDKYAASPAEFYEVIVGEEPNKHMLAQVEAALEQTSVELFNLAFERNYLLNQRVNFIYINTLLNDWKTNKITTVEMAQQRIKDIDSKQKTKRTIKNEAINSVIDFGNIKFNDEEF